MISMEREALDSIARNGGRLHYYLVAGELRISSGYAYVICKGLERSGYVDFDTFRGICSLTERGKDIMEKIGFLNLREKRKAFKRNAKKKKRILKNVETIHY